MDDTLNFSGDKDAILSQIDALNAQHRLQKLRELLDQSDYLRDTDSAGRTESLNKMSAEDIILLLWDRNKEIPPELTFGEPYDTAFKTFVTRHSYTRYHVPGFLYLLLRYADRLPLFMVYALQCNYAWIDNSHIEKIEEEIYDKIQLLSRGTRLTSVDKLQSALKNTTLSRIEIVYIAVMLDEIGCFHQELSLRDFILVCMR